MGTLLPVYYQIKQTIKGWIVNKEYDLGEKIPSETELATRFDANRLTIRQAISQLIQEGFLTSRRGEGTFVTKNENLINSSSFEFRGLIDDLFFAQISEIQTKSVEISRIKPPRMVREKLELRNEDEEIIQIKRVRYLKDKLLTYSKNYIPLAIGAKINEKTLFEKSLLRTLEEDLGIKFTEAVQTVEASFADQEVAEKLGIASGSPILSVERIMYTKGRNPVEIFQSSYRGDQYKFIIRLKNVTSKYGSKWVQKLD